MQSNGKSVAKTITILLMVLAALPLAAGGAWLLALGGSPYYLVAGLVLVLVSWLYVRNITASVWLYAVLLHAGNSG